MNDLNTDLLCFIMFLDFRHAKFFLNVFNIYSNKPTYCIVEPFMSKSNCKIRWNLWNISLIKMQFIFNLKKIVVQIYHNYFFQLFSVCKSRSVSSCNKEKHRIHNIRFLERYILKDFRVQCDSRCAQPIDRGHP